MILNVKYGKGHFEELICTVAIFFRSKWLESRWNPCDPRREASDYKAVRLARAIVRRQPAHQEISGFPKVSKGFSKWDPNSWMVNMVNMMNMTKNIKLMDDKWGGNRFFSPIYGKLYVKMLKMQISVCSKATNTFFNSGVMIMILVNVVVGT